MVVEGLQDGEAGGEAVARLCAFAGGLVEGLAALGGRRVAGGGGRGGGVVHGDHVEGALEGVVPEVWVLFGRPGRAAGQVVGGARPGGDGRGGEVEGVRLGDLHKVHKVALVEGGRGEEVGAVEDVLAVGRVGVNHGR